MLPTPASTRPMPPLVVYQQARSSPADVCRQVAPGRIAPANPSKRCSSGGTSVMARGRRATRLPTLSARLVTACRTAPLQQARQLARNSRQQHKHAPSCGPSRGGLAAQRNSPHLQCTAEKNSSPIAPPLWRDPNDNCRVVSIAIALLMSTKPNK